MEDNIFLRIRQWAQERGIYDKGDPKTQYVKLQEEAGELAKALLKNDVVEIKDGIGDCVVVLTNLAALCDMQIEECIQVAWDEIKDRKGKMDNGTFVKNEPKTYDEPAVINEDFDTTGVDKMKFTVGDTCLVTTRLPYTKKPKQYEGQITEISGNTASVFVKAYDGMMDFELEELEPWQ